MKKEMGHLLALAIPIIVGQISQTLFGFIDILMVGHLGTVELAAVSFANSIFVIFLVFGLGLTNATSPLIARALGRGDQHGARHILTDSLYVSVAAGLFLTVICLLCVLAFHKMGQSEEVLIHAKTFFVLTCTTLVPALLYQTMKQYLECIGRPIIPMLVAVGGLLANIGLNYVLIFGKGPFPVMGVAGAAFGTLIARVLMLVVLGLYIKWEKSHRSFMNQTPTHPPLRHLAVTKELLALGIPTAFIFTFEVGAFAFSTIMAGWLGVLSQAAHQVTMSLASLTFMVPMGLSVAAGIRVGQRQGSLDFEGSKKAATAGLICATAFMAVSALTFILGRNLFPLFFTKDVEVIRLAAAFLILGGLFQVSDGIQVVGASILRSMKDVQWPLAITFTSYWIVALPISYVLAFPFGLGGVGIWTGLFLGLTVAAVALPVRFYFLLAKQQYAATTTIPKPDL